MDSTVMGIGIVIAIASIGSLVLTGLVRHLAVIDVPNERSSHSKPTPRGGGIALVTMTVIGVLVSQVIWRLTSWRDVIFYVGPAILIAAVSWLDDLQSLSTTIRFTTHFVAAGILVSEFGYWENISLPFLGSIHIGQIGLALTLVWIVGITNAYNFMDGIDGIAGGQSLIAGSCWAIVGWLVDDKFVFALGGLLAASSLGFLYYNWAPAKIFMGDVGSAFLGFTFASVPVLASHSTSVSFDFMLLVGVLVIWPFILDTGFTLLRRLSKGENIFQAHRSHIYQRMVIAGYSHQVVSLLYIGLAIIGSILSVMIIKMN